MDKKIFTFLFWYFFILFGGLFALVSNFLIEMPYHRWLAENLPTWLGITNVAIFGACLVAMAMAIIRPQFFKVLAIVGLFSALTLRTSFVKAPVINAIILLFAGLLFVVAKKYYRKRKIQI